MADPGGGGRETAIGDGPWGPRGSGGGRQRATGRGPAPRKEGRGGPARRRGAWGVDWPDSAGPDL